MSISYVSICCSMLGDISSDVLHFPVYGRIFQSVSLSQHKISSYNSFLISSVENIYDPWSRLITLDKTPAITLVWFEPTLGITIIRMRYLFYPRNDVTFHNLLNNFLAMPFFSIHFALVPLNCALYAIFYAICLLRRYPLCPCCVF